MLEGIAMDRRTFNTALMSAAATSVVGSGSMAAAGRTVWYQGVGARLTHWDVDVEAAALTPRASITLPSNIQYVWPHPSRKYLYVSTSDAASGNAPNPGTVHRLCALRIDESGALSLHGDPAVLPQRPIHNSVDAPGNFALTCYNNPSNLTVHRINSDGTVGAGIPQEAKLDFGIFAHQILPMPGNRAKNVLTGLRRLSNLTTTSAGPFALS
jgi:6-phosphogluconolactonase (cycloisomerase 2 family)